MLPQIELAIVKSLGKDIDLAPDTTEYVDNTVTLHVKGVVKRHQDTPIYSKKEFPLRGLLAKLILKFKLSIDDVLNMLETSSLDELSLLEKGKLVDVDTVLDMFDKANISVKTDKFRKGQTRFVGELEVIKVKDGRKV